MGWRGCGPLGPAGRLATKTRFAKLCNSSILLLTINLRRDCCIPSVLVARRSPGALHIKRLNRRNRTLLHRSSRNPSNSKVVAMLLRATQRALRSGARRKSTVVMMRHGESTWNLENKFTGTKRGAEGRRPSSSSPRRAI